MYYCFIYLYLDFLLFDIHCGQQKKNFNVQGNMFPYCAYDLPTRI